MRKRFRRNKLGSESGVTLIELAIAGFVLVFGMLSLLSLVITAIGNNGRSKVDSSCTMLAQAVLEQVSAKIAGGGPGTLTDNANCNGTGTTFTIEKDPGGAPLISAGNIGAGNIDFTQAQVANYSMNYVECNNNVQRTYDVRWNVGDLSGKTYSIVVGARPAGGNGPVQFSFALPVNMRAFVGGN